MDLNGPRLGLNGESGESADALSGKTGDLPRGVTNRAERFSPRAQVHTGTRATSGSKSAWRNYNLNATTARGGSVITRLAGRPWWPISSACTAP